MNGIVTFFFFNQGPSPKVSKKAEPKIPPRDQGLPVVHTVSDEASDVIVESGPVEYAGGAESHREEVEIEDDPGDYFEDDEEEEHLESAAQLMGHAGMYLSEEINGY